MRTVFNSSDASVVPIVVDVPSRWVVAASLASVVTMVWPLAILACLIMFPNCQLTGGQGQWQYEGLPEGNVGSCS